MTKYRSKKIMKILQLQKKFVTNNIEENRNL